MADGTENLMLTHYEVIDTITGAKSTLLESARNIEWSTAQSTADFMCFYYTPVLVIASASETPVFHEGDYDYYSMKLQHMYSQLRTQAALRFSEKYRSQKITVSAGAVSGIRLSSYKYVLGGETEGISIVAQFPEDVQPTFTGLNPESILRCKVTKDARSRYQYLVRSKSLPLSLIISYCASGESRASFSISISSLFEGMNSQDLNIGGAQYVQASSIGDSVQNKIRTVVAGSVADAALTSCVDSLKNDVMTKLLKLLAEDDKTLSSKDLKDLDVALMRGANLDPQLYQPVQTMWKVCDAVKRADNKETANKQLQTHYANLTTKDKASFEAKGGWGPFSAKVGYEKEMTKANIESGYFENDESVSKFQEIFHTENGKEPRFTPRGLKMLNLTTIQQKSQEIVTATKSVLSSVTYRSVAIPAVWAATETYRRHFVRSGFALATGNEHGIHYAHLIYDGLDSIIDYYADSLNGDKFAVKQQGIFSVSAMIRMPPGGENQNIWLGIVKNHVMGDAPQVARGLLCGHEAGTYFHENGISVTAPLDVNDSVSVLVMTNSSRRVGVRPDSDDSAFKLIVCYLGATI